MQPIQDFLRDPQLGAHAGLWMSTTYANCPRAGTISCGTCNFIHYCLTDYQRADLALHQIVCHTFREFSTLKRDNKNLPRYRLSSIRSKLRAGCGAMTYMDKIHHHESCGENGSLCRLQWFKNVHEYAYRPCD